MNLDAYYLPPQFKTGAFTTSTFSNGTPTIMVRSPALTATTLSDLINTLIKAQERFLSRQPVERLLMICDEAVVRWLKPDEPHRRWAEEALPSITGFSPPMIHQGLTLMLEGLRADRLRKLIQEELGNPRFLDEFLPRLNGRSKAFGPRFMTHILAGNIPALPAVGLITSLLVKSASLLKTSSEAPLFAALFAKTLVEVEPQLSDCLAVVGWKGGSEEARGIEEVVFNRSELVMATGSDETIAELKKQLASLNATRLISYGHRVSFGLVGREALSDLNTLAGRAAYDSALYDQVGCLSPHLFYVETGGEHSPREFAKALGEAFGRLENTLPRGTVATRTAATLHHFRSLYEMKQADGSEIGIFGSEAGNLWTVIYEEDPAFALSPLHRTVRVKPIIDLSEVAGLVSSWRPYLQAAGIAVSPQRLLPLVERLAEAGVNRITPIGRMQEPSVGWHQDGRLTFSDLVRWVNVEE